MPIEIRRFGVGHRRPDGPAGTVGVTAQVIHSDGRGLVSELAFARGARIEPHASPNTAWLIVIEGGGWVGVGDERTRVAAGEAVQWPPDTTIGAWTEHSEMRVIMVEFAADDETIVGGFLESHAADVVGRVVERGVGQLQEPVGEAREGVGRVLLEGAEVDDEMDGRVVGPDVAAAVDPGLDDGQVRSGGPGRGGALGHRLNLGPAPPPAPHAVGFASPVIRGSRR